MSIGDGTFVPPEPRLVCQLGFRQALDVPVDLESINLYAGAQLDTATLRLPTIYAEPGTVSMGGRAKIYLGSDLVFRGIVGDAPMTIGEGSDELQLVLFGEKWLLSRRVIGQPNIGSEGSGWQKGFACVGQEIIFNKDGRPNKLLGSLDFSTSLGLAEYWTYKYILQWMAQYYMDSEFSLSTSSLDAAFDRSPSHLSLVGQTVLQAVNLVFEQAGQTWSARPSASHSNIRAVRPDYGTTRTIRLFTPGRRARVTQATHWSAEGVDVGLSLVNVRDYHIARSAPVVIEHTYSSTGSDPLLDRKTDFADPRYEAMFAVDVTKYASHSLGRNLPAYARPKALWRDLVTRRGTTDDTYLTAAQIEADPEYSGNERMEIPVWLSVDGTEAKARLVTGGYDIDLDLGLVMFEAEVELLQDDGTRETVEVDWSAAEIWVTLATELEYSETSTTDEENTYLPDSMYQLLDRPDLVPEKRYKAWLPDLADMEQRNTVSKIATSEVEDYVDVSGRLDDYAAAAAEAMPAVERRIHCELPFMPRPQIGDQVRISGRDTDAQGDEVILTIVYDGQRSLTAIDASNVVAGTDPASDEVGA